MSRSFRVLPALLVGALLILALAAPSRRAPVPAADASFTAGSCLQFQGGGSGSVVGVPSGQMITQPVGYLGNVESCSLTVNHVYGRGLVEVIAWDPVTLAPDPTTLALGTQTYNESALLYGWTRAKFYPPVIVASVAHSADPIRQTVAINYRPGTNGQDISFEQSGDVETPQARQFDNLGNPVALPGAHPLLAHAVCGGDANINDLRVIQSVTTTNTIAADTSSGEVLQLFTVPVPTAVYWAEVAPGGTPGPPVNAPDVTIIDTRGNTTPPQSFSNTDILAQQYLAGYYRLAWTAAYDFSQRPVLEPGHFYWLRIRTYHGYALHGRTRLAQESWDFNFGVGALYQRSNKDVSWQPVEGKSVSFRLIGEQLGPSWVGVPNASPSASLRLRVAPNPARGSALVQWAGAQGAVRLTVLDARGRRMGGAQVTGADGQWRFAAAADNGSPLPAGVYFVRAIDARGASVTERVVIQR